MVMRLIGYVITTFVSFLMAVMTTELVGLALDNTDQFMPFSYKVFMFALFGVFSVIGVLAVNEISD